MNERDIREGIAQVRARVLSRRQFWRKWVSAVGHRLRGTEISGWDSSFWNLAHWYREA